MSKFIRDIEIDNYSSDNDSYVTKSNFKRKKVRKFKDNEDKKYKNSKKDNK